MISFTLPEQYSKEQREPTTVYQQQQKQQQQQHLSYQCDAVTSQGLLVMDMTDTTEPVTHNTPLHKLLKYSFIERSEHYMTVTD